MSDEITIDCDQKMRVNEVNDLHEKLVACLGQAKLVNFNLKQVAEIDTASLQLLAAFIKKATAQGIEVKWLNIPEVFSNQAKLLGIHEHLHLELEH